MTGTEALAAGTPSPVGGRTAAARPPVGRPALPPGADRGQERPAARPERSGSAAGGRGRQGGTGNRLQSPGDLSCAAALTRLQRLHPNNGFWAPRESPLLSIAGQYRSQVDIDHRPAWE